METEKIRRKIDARVRMIAVLAREIDDILEELDTKTVDALELYEYEPKTNLGCCCTRFEFFRGANTIDCLRRYFNDERWAEWELSRDEERGFNA